MNPKHCTIRSSEGNFIINRHNGKVVKKPEDCIPEYRAIVKFNVAEYIEFWKHPVPDESDILNFGYWDVYGRYEKPAYEWREELKQYITEQLNELTP